jgi:oligopeptide transport system substrate-binding protein
VTHVFVELTRLNEVTTELEPGFATSWDVDEAARTYTFHLMEGVPWVRFNPETGQVEQVLDENGNVRYVTAHDFAYSWTRHLDPAQAAQYSYLQSEYVEGGTAYNSGEVC